MPAPPAVSPTSPSFAHGLAALTLTPWWVVLLACGPNGPASGLPAAAPTQAEVGVVTATLGTVGLLTELPGRTEASRVAQVRARVAGIVQRQQFREGSDVKAGQALFQIDAAPFKAALASAQAAQARAEANLMQAQAQATRYKPLLDANAISQQDYVNAVAAQKLAEADVAAGKAAVQTAQINLGYASVTSPIAGRVGRALVTEGALVGQGEATPLALVQRIDPIYVNITQPVADVLRLRTALASGQLKRAAAGQAVAVRLVLDDGSVYSQAGRLIFSDLSVDPSSGQITLRAEVPNPEGQLLPGMYVRARLEQSAASGAMLLPQQAVQRSAQGDNVMVVGADGTVAPRPVKVGVAKDGQWVVLGGLKAGEQVMVDGFQKLKGNSPVKAVPWQGAGAAPSTANAPPGGAATAAAAASRP
ncbi:MAG: efflux RND transporter periplasmic adaptor subunit [Ideonella sp.]|nr:efflux RND transporter periplasmic adaptor subunit [Ideonella sp.]